MKLQYIWSIFLALAAASAVAGASPSPTTSSIVGDWVSTGSDGSPISYSFKEDGVALWAGEDAKYLYTTHCKYRIDPSTRPQSIEFFDMENLPKGGNVRAIFEVQSDGRLRIEFQGEPKAPPLKEFTKEAMVFSKATSPLVRSNKPPPPPPSPDELLVKEAVQRYDRGDCAGAMEGVEKAIAHNPKNARAFFYRGLCFYSRKDWPTAIADFEKAMELDPSLKLEDLIEKTKVLRGSGKNK